MTKIRDMRIHASFVALVSLFSSSSDVWSAPRRGDDGLDVELPTSVVETVKPNRKRRKARSAVKVEGAPDFQEEAVLEKDYGEGTETELSPEVLAHLTSLGINLKTQLVDALEDMRNDPLIDQKTKMLTRIDLILEGDRTGLPEGTSEPGPGASTTRTEKFFRYGLKRAKKLVELIDIETKDNSNKVGILDAQVAILRESINFVTRYYNDSVEVMRQLDKERRELEEQSENEKRRAGEEGADALATIPTATPVPLKFAEFGIDYVNFLMNLTWTILDASAQYRIAVNALGMFHVDLANDQNLEFYKAAITQIHTFRVNLKKKGIIDPKTKRVVHRSDKEAIVNLRNLKLVYARAKEKADRALEEVYRLQAEDDD